MKNNKALAVSSVLLISAVVWLGYKTYIQTRPAKTVNYFGGEEINKFCINDFCLEKSNEKWIVNKSVTWPADNQIADSFANKLKNLTLGDIISTNKERFEELGIDSNKLVIEANGKILWTGKINRSYDSTYVSYENSEAVYEADMVLNRETIGNIEYWQQKEVTNLPVYQIKKITIKHGNKTKEYAKDKDKWDDEKFVEKISHLSSTKIYINFNPEGSDVFEYNIETESGVNNLRIGKKTISRREKQYWASGDNKYYFEITELDYGLLTATKI